MKNIRVRIDGITVQVSSDFARLIATVADALRAFEVDVDDSSREGPVPTFTINVRRLSNATSALGDTVHPEWQTFDFEGGMRYRYSRQTSQHHVEIGARIRGRLDFEAGTVEWLVEELPPDRPALAMLVLDPLSLLLPKFDLLICHCSALRVKNRVVLIFGRSGHGKSTVSFLASHETTPNSVRWLSDDTVLIDTRHGRAIAHPIHTGFSVSDDLIMKFMSPQHAPDVQYRTRDKIYLRNVPQRAPLGAQIDKLIFLAKSSSASENMAVNQLTVGATVQLLLGSQSSISSPYVLRRVQLCAVIARQAKAFSLRYQDICDIQRIREILNLDIGHNA